MATNVSSLRSDVSEDGSSDHGGQEQVADLRVHSVPMQVPREPGGENVSSAGSGIAEEGSGDLSRFSDEEEIELRDIRYLLPVAIAAGMLFMLFALLGCFDAERTTWRS